MIKEICQEIAITAKHIAALDIREKKALDIDDTVNSLHMFDSESVSKGIAEIFNGQKIDELDHLQELTVALTGLLIMPENITESEDESDVSEEES